MANVSDFPVTTPYGQVQGYPLNNGFHTGIDYGCPTGTSVIVNGVITGLTGNTGTSTGPHCHVGKYINGQVQNPGVGNGFSFKSAVVTEIGQDSTNGKFVRVQGDGASWVYLHLSDNGKVKVGQVLQGDDMAMTPEQVTLAYQFMVYRNPSQQELEAGLSMNWFDLETAIDQTEERKKITGKVNDYDHLYKTATDAQNEAAALQKELDGIKNPIQLKSGIYKVGE